MENSPRIAQTPRPTLTALASGRNSGLCAAQRIGGQKVLVAEDVAVFRGEKLVFRDLSLTVPAGGAVVLAGPERFGQIDAAATAGRAGAARSRTGGVEGADVALDIAVHARRWLTRGIRTRLSMMDGPSDEGTWPARTGSG